MYRNMKQWQEVRHAVFVAGLTVNEAKEKFGLHDTTVKKMLAHSEPPGYQMGKARKKRTIGPFLTIIKEILESDKNAPRKQRHTTMRIFQRLRDEHGYTGGKTAVYDAVNDLKKSCRDIYVPLSHLLGEAQFDFGHATAEINGVMTKIAFAELSLPYSNVRYLQVFPRECTETFQEGLKRAFHFLGGVPTLIKFDNSKIAAAKIVGGRGQDPTNEFLRISSHFLFDYHFCRVRQPQEKGHVEGSVKYSRNNFLVPVPKFDDFETFNSMLEQQCREDMNREASRQKRTIQEAFAEEKESLRPLPATEFEARRIECHHANSFSLIRFDNNDYSVPSEHAHKEFTVVGGVDTVKFLVAGQLVATHRRDWGKKETHLNPVHYLKILERRPNALDFGKPFESWDLPKEFGTLRRRLEAAGKKQGLRAFIKILRLLENSTLENLSAAIRRALSSGCVSYEAIRFSLRGFGELPVDLFVLDDRPHLQTVRLPLPNLDVYANLAKEMTYEKTRNQIHSVIETPSETVKTSDEGTRVRADRTFLREGECRSPRLSAPTGGTRIIESGISSDRATPEGGEVSECKNTGEFRFPCATEPEQDAGARIDAWWLYRQSGEPDFDRPAGHRQDASCDSVRSCGLPAGKESEVLSRDGLDYENDGSTRGAGVGTLEEGLGVIGCLDTG
jgi:transposase